MSLFQDYRTSVQKEWIDYNGHMNVAYYVLAFDHATDALLEQIDLGVDYRTREEKSVFVVESHISYEQEVEEEAPLLIKSRLLGADKKRLHIFHEMFHEVEGYRAATIEIMALHVDMKTRKTANFMGILEDKLAKWGEESLKEGWPTEAGRIIKRLGSLEK